MADVTVLLPETIRQLINMRNQLLILLTVLALVSLSASEKMDSEDNGPKRTMDNVDVVIGIDLGTTHSSVGVFLNGRVEIIANEQGNRITPSCVAFTSEGKRLIGDAAKSQLATNPENTICDVKRIIGRRYTDKTVQEDIKKLPYKVVDNNNRLYIQVQIGSKTRIFAIEEITAMLLGKMKEIAEAYLRKMVTHAVVTVPANFNNAQRQATKDAGLIAGLNVTRIYSEPVAAAIAYGLDKKDGMEKNIIVFNLGGGTCDVSLLAVADGVFEVVATSGDTHLGGEDFDQRVMEHFIKLYNKKKGKDLRTDVRAVQRLRREVEKAKRALSSAYTARIEIESLFGGEDFSETLTRDRFEELNIDLFHNTMKPILKVLIDSSLKMDDIAEIVLVGGSTRIPKVRQLVKELFNNREPNRGVNPEEAVAYGAAVQAGVLGGAEGAKEIVLLDVCPLTLGVETDDGEMSELIPRNTAIPIKKSRFFSTVVDNQQTVTIKVYEGERQMTKDNQFLGEFDLTGIPNEPRGVPQIEVTFEIDANGILQASAQDTNGHKSQTVISTNKNSLSPEDIEKMFKVAEMFADRDTKARERIEAMEDLESYVYTMRTRVKDKSALGGKLTSKEKFKMETAIQSAIDWLEKNQREAQTETLIAKKSELESALQSITSKLHQRQPRTTGNKMKIPVNMDQNPRNNEL